MYRSFVCVWIILLCLCTTPAIAFREDTTSDGLQMDTMMSLSQPDPNMRFLQTLTNQQQDIQNLNAALQKNQQESEVEMTRIDQRIDFFYLIFWCLIAINAFFFLIIIVMGVKIKSLSNKISQQPSIESFLPPISKPEPPTFKQPTKKKQPSLPQKIDLTGLNEDEELDELLDSVKDDDIAAIFPDSSNDNFFQYFQGEIDRERKQLNRSKDANSQLSTDSNEDELLDELINQHFSGKSSMPETIKK